MILSRFPDLAWLKKQIDERFRFRAGRNLLNREGEGFPSCIIRTKVTESYRPDILGPISLFMNREGASRVAVDGRTVVVPRDSFFLSNRMQAYTLEIDSAQPVYTYNIHIGEYLSEQALGAWVTPADHALDNGLQQAGKNLSFYNQLYRKDAALQYLIRQFEQLEDSGNSQALLFEELMMQLVRYLLGQHRDIIKKIGSMPPVKMSTRVELYRRLSAAADFLHQHPFDAPQLDTLASIACLSKFHFIRLFKQVYDLSPYQYLQELRMEQACSLLRTTRVPVADITLIVGFENPHSFSRLFFRRMKRYPSQYRLEAN